MAQRSSHGVGVPMQSSQCGPADAIEMVVLYGTADAIEMVVLYGPADAIEMVVLYAFWQATWPAVEEAAADMRSRDARTPHRLSILRAVDAKS